MESRIGPVMEADLEPGLAWMVMATEEGGTGRRQEGKLSAELLPPPEEDRVDWADFGCDLLFLAGGIASDPSNLVLLKLHNSLENIKFTILNFQILKATNQLHLKFR